MDYEFYDDMVQKKTGQEQAFNGRQGRAGGATAGVESNYAVVDGQCCASLKFGRAEPGQLWAGDADVRNAGSQ